MDIINRIQSLEKSGINPGLERISAMLGHLGHPEQAYPVMLVGGTNGKGSTCAMIESILRHAGLKTGLYTSPHLVRINERVTVENTMIPDASLEKIGHQLFTLMEDRTVLAGITYFEFLTALALVYFREQHVDLAVLEVGMGGKFDATNAARPLVSTITNVALDHQEYLGSTLEVIAAEKAGILRPGRPLITTETNPQSLQVLETLCRRAAGIFSAVDRDFSFDGNEAGMNFSGGKRTIKNIRLPLQGRHQLYNASAAIQSVLSLETAGIQVTDHAIREGILKTSWPGRFETIRHNPDVVLDAAHNPAGIAALAETMRNMYRNKYATVIFAVSKDKDWRSMLPLLAGIANTLVLTSYEGERSADPEDLQTAGRTAHTVIIPSSRSALRYALDRTPGDGVIIVTGSIYLIGELKKETG